MSGAKDDLGALLNAASSGLTTLGDRVLKPLGLTSAQWKVLVVLARRGAARISALVQVLQHDQAAVSRLVTRMERAGFVRRDDDPADARAGIVRLTARGEKTYQRCEARLRPLMNTLEKSFEPSERALLRSLLSRLVFAIEAASESTLSAQRQQTGHGGE